MIKEEEQALQKQEKQNNEQMAAEKPVMKIQPPLSEIALDIEEITTRSNKERKDFQNIQLLGAPIPQQSGVKMPTLSSQNSIDEQ